MTITMEQLARLVRYAEIMDDFLPKPPTEPYCPMCFAWENGATLSRPSVEAAGLTWRPKEGYTSMWAWELVDLRPWTFTPDEQVIVIAVRQAEAQVAFGAYWGSPVRQRYVAVHSFCWEVEHLNGRRKGGIMEERICVHCGRSFFSHHRLDWCHACVKPETAPKTCERCGKEMPKWSPGYEDPTTEEWRQHHARKDARFCSGRCRVAAHRASAVLRSRAT